MYSLDYFSSLGLAQYTILVIFFFTCTTHILSLYKALCCTLLYTHQYTDYSNFLSYFIFLTIDISKLVCYGRIISLEDGNEKWVSFKYDRLPNLCYWYAHLLLFFLIHV